MLKVLLLQQQQMLPPLAAWCSSSAPAAPHGAPGGSGRLGTSGVEARPQGARPLPWVLERAASNVADSAAFDPSGSSERFREMRGHYEALADDCRRRAPGFIAPTLPNSKRA